MKRALAPLVLLSLCFVTSALAQTVPTKFRDELVVGGLDVPCAFAFLPDGRILVAEQLSAKVRLILNGAVGITDPVFTVPTVVTGGEQGLLGIAIDPQYPARPYLYTHQTDAGGFVRISRWKIGGDLSHTDDGQVTVKPASRYDLITNAPNSASNHNGGTLQFGPGGYLFVSLGEDANACAAQDLITLRGKILRLDVHALPDGAGSAYRAQITPPDNPFVASPDSNARLVYVNGLRNPFRFQMDMAGERLVVGDVGQGLYEELDLIDATGNTGITPGDGRGLAGGNFGWPWREGLHSYTTCTGSQPATVNPVWEYDRSAAASASIISAGCYRSSTPDTTRWPVEYHGNLFFNDYYSGVLTRLVPQGSAWVLPPLVPGQSTASAWGTGYNYVADWRVGANGSLYYARQLTGSFRNTGSIRRITWAGGATVGVDPDAPMLPGALLLSSRPAPARGGATIFYDLASAVSPPLRIYDVRGRLVRTLAVPAGSGAHFEVHWDGADDAGERVPSGVYWARIAARGRQATCRIALLR